MATPSFGPGFPQPATLPSTMKTPAAPAGGLAKLGIKHGGIMVEPTKKPDATSVTTIIVYGDKDSGKSCAPVGIPHKRGRMVVIACDDTTAETLVNYYGPNIFDTVELYEVTRRRVGADGKEIYPGFDPDRVVTGEIVFGNLMLILDQLEKDGNVECLIVDHFQALYEKVAVTYAKSQSGLGPDDRMQLEHWMHRTQSMDQIEAKIRRTPMAGGVAVITGYGAEEKTTYVEVTDAQGRPKKKVVRQMTDPKWLKDDIKRNWHVQLKVESTRSTMGVPGKETSEDNYSVEVISSKSPRFHKGSKMDITGKSLAVFWENQFGVAA